MAHVHLAEERQNLFKQTKKILKDLSKRRNLVFEVQQKKRELGLETYDPVREEELFQSLRKELDHLSLEELLSFSLIIESQAGGTYPNWFDGEHLAGDPVDCADHMNPVLLKVSRPEIFKKVALNGRFNHLMDT